MREGDQVEQRALLFTLDDDLQRADVAMQEAAVKNAQQAYRPRAGAARRPAPARRRAFDEAEAALRTAQARLNSSQTRLARRKVFSPVAGTVQQIYFRVGEMVPAGKPVLALLPPGNMKVRFFVSEAMLPKITLGDTVQHQLRRLRSGLTAQGQLHRPHRRIHAAGDLQPGGAQPSSCSWSRRGRTQPERLRVGQPVSVTLGAAGGQRGEVTDRRPTSPSTCTGLTKSFGNRKVVRDLSMQVKRGTIYGFLGPNGSGKTTTIRMLYRPADAGRRRAAPASATTSAPRPTRSSAMSAT